MAAAAEVGVIGMRALRRDINKLADDESSALYRAIKAAGKAAVEPVAARARAAFPNDSGTLSGDVRTSGTKTGGTVRVGRVKVPYAGWVEFGGTRHTPHESTRAFVPTGRYLFPSAEGMAPRAAELYAQALSRIFADPSVWTNTTDNGAQVHD